MGRKGRTRESLQAQVVEGLRRVTGWEGVAEGTGAVPAREERVPEGPEWRGGGLSRRTSADAAGTVAREEARDVRVGDAREGSPPMGDGSLVEREAARGADRRHGDDARAAGAAGPGGVSHEGDF